MPNWVRSWDTKVLVAKTKGEFEALMRRYGATGFTVSEEYATHRVLLSFFLPIAGRPDVEIAFAIDYRKTLSKLQGVPEFQSKTARQSIAKRDEWRLEQAKRVAWRHLVLYTEAALNAVDAGALTLEEAFMAQRILTDGVTRVRAADLVDALATKGRITAASEVAR